MSKQYAPIDMTGRISITEGTFCTWYPKCEHGKKCPSRYDDKARAAERQSYFKTRQNVKKYENQPLCFNELGY